MKIKTHILILLLFVFNSVYSQKLDSLIQLEENKLKQIDKEKQPQNYFNQAISTIKFYNQNGLYLKSEMLISLINTLKHITTTSDKIQLYITKANTSKIAHKNDLAFENYLNALSLLEKSNNKTLYINTCCDIAEYFRAIGNFNYARSYIIKAQNLFNKNGIKNDTLQCRIYHRYAAILNENSASDSVLIYTKLNINLAKKINNYDALGTSYNELGFYYKNKRISDSSTYYYIAARDIFMKSNQFYDAANAYYNYCQLLSHNTLNQKNILSNYHKLLDFIRQNKISYPLTRIYFDMSFKYYFLGDSLNWYKYMANFLKENDKENERTNQINLSNQLAKYEKEKALIEKNKTEVKLKSLRAIFNEEKQRNTAITIVASLFLILITIICYLYFKNYKKNKILQNQNKVKDTLIQEIHHRVKNNLQFVNSIINMQISSDNNKSFTEPLYDAARRISSMALVHEMLYNQNNTEGINIKTYIDELVLLINDAVNSTKLPIKFTINCDAIIFDSAKATAIGMIVTELISNSIKHAFNNVKTPSIEIKLLHQKEDVILEVKDNGNGLQENNSSKKGIGTRLIDIFSRQLKGDYITNSSPMGFTYKIKFKH